MRVLVTGAYGLIGSAILARLNRDGHELVGCGRALVTARRRFPYARWIEADFARLTQAQAWLPLLAGVEAVVNCVGVLQDSARDDVVRVHVDGTVALFDACVRAGIRRVVQVPAIGADAAAPTPFAPPKAQGDAHLAGLDLDWVILRPALVLAPAAHGGSAMLRGLAGVPLVTPVAAADSRLQIVSIDDVAATVALSLRPGAAARVTWELAHPQLLTLGALVRTLRDWHGFPPQPQWSLPRAAEGVIAWFAGVAAWLGGRAAAGGGPRARTPAVIQLEAGVIGNPEPWIAATGIKPKSLADILAERPASVQDRWFARLYLLKPLAIVCLALFWIATGLIALGPGRASSLAHLDAAGVHGLAADLILVGGALFDIVLGCALLVRRTARVTLIVMLTATPVYVLVGSILAPQLWADPLGPLTKIVPMMVAILFT